MYTLVVCLVPKHLVLVPLALLSAIFLPLALLLLLQQHSLYRTPRLAGACVGWLHCVYQVVVVVVVRRKAKQATQGIKQQLQNQHEHYH